MRWLSMPTSRSPQDLVGLSGPFEDVPQRVKVVVVTGWLVVVGLTYLAAWRWGWSLRPRGDARSPLFMLIPTLGYWSVVALVLSRLHLRSRR